jgi:hypothetical protein
MIIKGGSEVKCWNRSYWSSITWRRTESAVWDENDIYSRCKCFPDSSGGAWAFGTCFSGGGTPDGLPIARSLHWNQNI